MMGSKRVDHWSSGTVYKGSAIASSRRFDFEQKCQNICLHQITCGHENFQNKKGFEMFDFFSLQCTGSAVR
jgi:hypothetical protein